MKIIMNRKSGVLIPKLVAVVGFGWVVGSLGNVQPYNSAQLMSLELDVTETKAEMVKSKNLIHNTAITVNQNSENISHIQNRLVILEDELKQLNVPE